MRSFIGVTLLIVSCGGSKPPDSAANPASSTTPATTTVATGSRGFGYDLVVQATSCWLGGLWSDALGEKEYERSPGIEKRCKGVLTAIGEPDTSYAPLRAVEPKMVTALSEAVRHKSTKDENSAALVSTLTLVADATREMVEARHAADQVKEAAEKDKSQYGLDKISASPVLRKNTALHALLGAATDPYAADARAIGMLFAIDRMQIAHGLPKHLKIFVVGPPLADVFGVASPPVSEDGSMKIQPGLWSGYLDSVSSAAGHAVPADLKKPEDRETFAWNGVLDGLGDKLRTASKDVPPSGDLGKASAAVSTRLTQQMEIERAHLKAQGH